MQYIKLGRVINCGRTVTFHNIKHIKANIGNSSIFVVISSFENLADLLANDIPCIDTQVELFVDLNSNFVKNLIYDIAKLPEWNGCTVVDGSIPVTPKDVAPDQNCDEML